MIIVQNVITMIISIVGGGYVGLVSAACFAALGHSVELIEIDNDKVKAIHSGKLPIYEKGLEKLVSEHLGKNLFVINKYDNLCNSDLTFICVGTPSNSDGSANLSMIKSACRSIGESLHDVQKYHVVAVKSTVPPGTTENVVIPTILKFSDRNSDMIGFAMNPEFLREGVAIKDFMEPDRIVIGSPGKKAGDFVELAYKRLNAPLLRTDLTAAEMIKYASNALLATKISFSNEVGNLCKKLGVDVYDVMHGVGLDHRISPHFLNAGAGFGGSCFPKDVSALVRLADSLGEDPFLLKSVMEVNERQPLRMVDMLEKKIGAISGKRIAVLGLAFKSDTDDVRESRAIPVILELKSKGAEVVAYDPLAEPSMCKIMPDINYCDNVSDALSMVDACLIMTEWDEFRQLDEEFDLMKSKVIIEGRKILSCKDVEGICW